MITPIRRVSNTGSLRLAAAGGVGGKRMHHWKGREGWGEISQRGHLGVSGYSRGLVGVGDGENREGPAV